MLVIVTKRYLEGFWVWPVYSYAYFNFVPDMYVIFAVTKAMEPVYKEFAKFIDQKDNVGILTGTESALRDLIQTQYEEIKSMYY